MDVSKLSGALHLSSYFLLLASFALMPLHILLESQKWRLLLAENNISITTSLKAVCMGVSFGFITPGRVGDVIGRLFDLKKEHRWKAALAAIFNGMSQTIPTALLGGLSAFILFFQEMSLLNFLVGFLAAFVAILYALCLSHPEKINGILINIWNGLSLPEIQNKEVFHNSQLPKNVLLLSFFRYAIFFLQFYLVLNAFNCPISFQELLLLIPFYFAIITLIPSFFLGKLGIRESVLLFLWSFYWPDTLALLAASLAIWVINQLIPALVGWIFILQKK